MTKLEKIKKLAQEALGWQGGMNDHVHLAIAILEIIEDDEVHLSKKDFQAQNESAQFMMADEDDYYYGWLPTRSV